MRRLARLVRFFVGNHRYRTIIRISERRAQLLAAGDPYIIVLRFDFLALIISDESFDDDIARRLGFVFVNGFTLRAGGDAGRTQIAVTRFVIVVFVRTVVALLFDLFPFALNELQPHISSDGLAFVIGGPHHQTRRFALPVDVAARADAGFDVAACGDETAAPFDDVARRIGNLRLQTVFVIPTAAFRVRRRHVEIYDQTALRVSGASAFLDGFVVVTAVERAAVVVFLVFDAEIAFFVGPPIRVVTRTVNVIFYFGLRDGRTEKVARFDLVTRLVAGIYELLRRRHCDLVFGLFVFFDVEITLRFRLAKLRRDGIKT